MSHYQEDYERLVTRLTAAYPREQAMSMAVGGDFIATGDKEYAILKHFGLRPESYLIDVGCGSGRLTHALFRANWTGNYLGVEIVQSLLDHAQTQAQQHWHFQITDGLTINTTRYGLADMICFFSVLTHLKPEEGYVYLEQAYAALKTGGRAVVSYLSYAYHWSIFAESLDRIRRRAPADHLNTFLQPETLALWASELGFRVVTLNSQVCPDFGQSLCILEK